MPGHCAFGEFGELIAEHQGRVADLQFAVADQAAGVGVTHTFRGIEGPLVELHGLSGSTDGEVEGDGGVSQRVV